MKETAKKLFTAYVGESQARNRYTFFSKVAKKEGYAFVSYFFLETANQEKEHVNWFYKMLQGFKKEESFDEMKVLPDAEFPTTHGTTVENLKSAMAGEDMEWQTLYPDIAETAEKEGYPERYGKLLKLVGDDAFFKRGSKVVWICMECGYEVEMDELPKNFKCPSCDHSQAYYKKKCEDF